MAEEKIKEEVIEETKAEETEEAATEEVSRDIEKELLDITDKYMRTLAEYDNYRKRTVKEKEAIYSDAKAVVATAFLSVMDDLERAIDAAEEKTSFYDGVVLVKKKLDDTFKNIGVEAIETVGNEFDPNFHNAVMHIDDENYGNNEIVEEFQKGYKIGDRVIRHSMVKVAN